MEERYRKKMITVCKIIDAIIELGYDSCDHEFLMKNLKRIKEICKLEE